MKDLSKEYLNYTQTTYKETLANAGADDMGQLSGEQVLQYGADDSIVTAALFDLFYTRMCMEGTWDFCFKYEFPTAYTLYEAFESGLEVDFDQLSALAKEDAVTMETSMATIRELLTQHCMKPNPQGAERLFYDLKPFYVARMEHDNKTEEEIDYYLDDLRTKIQQGSRYRPLVTTKKEVNFKPTKTQINKVITSLGFDFELEGVSKSKINSWAVVADSIVEPDSDEHAFVQALIDAAPEINKREGQAYERFHMLCTAILQENGKEETSGDELNFDSPPQQQALLYAKLGLPIRLRSKPSFGSMRDKLGFAGAPATNEKAIKAALADDVGQDDWRRELLQSVLTYKGASTRFKFYYNPYPKWKHPRDGRVHPQFTNCGTLTRRLSSSSPNGLQISSKGAIRTAIKGKGKDHVILSPDFNGEELRITASMSNDPIMLDAYIGEARKDLHSLTGSAIAPIMLPRLDPKYEGIEEVSYEDFAAGAKDEIHEAHKYYVEIRKLAKEVNFLILYVGGASTLAINLGVPTDVAQAFIDAVMNRYPRLHPWQQESIKFARENGYVLTAYGNRRHLSRGIHSKDDYIRTKHERMAVNSQVQGTGSDLLKIVLSEMDNRRLLQRLHGSLIVPPHDEVALSVPRAAAWEAWLEMKEIMSITPPGHPVPQMPELKCSALNWGTCIELGATPTEELFNETLDKQLAERSAA